MTKGDRSAPRKARGGGAGNSEPKGKRGRAAIALRILRDWSGLGQKELAARTKVRDRRVGSYERGRSQLEAGHLDELLEAMELPYAAWSETIDFLERLEWHRSKYRVRSGGVRESEAPGAVGGLADAEPADTLREIDRVARAAGRAEERKTYDTLRMLLLGKGK